MTDEQIIEFARKYTVDQLGAFDYVASIVNVGTAIHHVCNRLVKLHDADQARRERLRSIGRKGGQANKGVPRVSLRRDIKRS
jgi:hypothetical protein